MSNNLWSNPYAFVSDHDCACGLQGWAMRKGRWLFLRPDAQARLTHSLQAQITEEGATIHGATFSVEPTQWFLSVDVQVNVVNYPSDLIQLLAEPLDLLGIVGYTEVSATQNGSGRYLVTYQFEVQ